MNRNQALGSVGDSFGTQPGVQRIQSKMISPNELRAHIQKKYGFIND